VWRSGKSRWDVKPPSTPDGVRIYAVGDVHGRADLLQSLLAAIDHDLIRHPARRSIEVFLGDYVDRGPASREVLDILLKRGRTRETVFLKGNHDMYVTEFLKDPSMLNDWREFGGFETLMSYGVVPILSPDRDQQSELATQFAHALPQAHLQWLRRLKSSFICGDYFFVHAGVRPGVPLVKQDENDLLLIRDEFLLCEQDFSKVIVHGHTPVSEPDVRSNRINIDTGAYATGQLTCLILESHQMHLLRIR
jgi:serine/threonine protein phosphatase 1